MMHPTSKAMVKAVQRRFDFILRDIEREVVGQPRYVKNINAAQNTLRTCLEATLNKLLPYDGDLLVELAIRLASYAISAAPIEDQEELVAKFIGVFAEAHLRRICEGKTIKTQWEMPDGSTKPNFPE